MPKKNLEKKIKEGEDEIVRRLKSIKENERMKITFDLRDTSIEDKFKSINFQPIKPDSWNDDAYLQKHLSRINTEILLPKLSKNINFDITIEKDGKLILAPGTNLTLGANNRIVSYGKILAKGESNNRIKISNHSGVMPLIGNSSIWDKIGNAIESRESTASYLIHASGPSPECIFHYCDLYGKNVNVGNAKLVMEYCTLERSYSGGGLSASTSDIDIKNTKINGNYHNYFMGGGMLLKSCRGSIYSSEILFNNADHGGGIYMDDCTLSFNANRVKGNVVTGKLSEGGGMYLQNSQLTGDNNTIENNRSDGDAGGILLKNSGFQGVFNLVTSNTTKRQHGGIKISGLSYHNCSEFGNTELNIPWGR
jgi:hypothetical protein